MRNSMILYLVQQSACALTLLGCAGARMLSQRRPAWRMLVVALLCGLITAASVQAPTWLRMTTLLLMLLAAPPGAWPGLSPRLYARLSALLAALTLLFAGWMRLLATLALPPALMLPAALCATPLLQRLWPSGGVATCLALRVFHRGCELRTTALVDTGNLLRDPLTGLPVIVLSREAASRVTTLPAPGRLQPGMRLIPVRTVTGRALMPVFRPESIRLRTAEGWREARAILGVSPGTDAGFQALIPSSLLTHISSEGGVFHDHDLPAGIHRP